MFDSREELTDWVSTTAKRLGFVLVTRRSRKNRAGIVTKVVFVCDRHGEYTGKGLMSSRATSTKKYSCPFELEGSYREYDGWKVIVKNHNHNHSKSWGLQGHAYARRMTEQEKEYVEELYALNLPVKDILYNLKQRFPENLSISNDIYNAIKDIKKKAEDEIGSSPMQVMLSLLRNNNYIFEYTLNDENQMENLFFVHPQSFELWRAFPQLLIIDATYKTNVYNMPFVEVVGVTSTSKTFLVACAFVVNEKGGTYDWVLLRLNEVVGFNKVTAILTDRDRALMGACRDVIPDAGHLLCRFHISQNIEKVCEKSFPKKNSWAHFMGKWNKLINSPTQQLYEENEADLKLYLAQKQGTCLNKHYYQQICLLLLSY